MAASGAPREHRVRVRGAHRPADGRRTTGRLTILGPVRIDLHTHSTASDGTDAPGEVVGAAAAAGLDVVALTDHDTTAGWAQATDAALRHGVALVRGAEISARSGGISVHVLSYLHDPAHERDARAQRGVGRLRPAGGRVVVGERDDVEARGLGGREQLGGALSAVGDGGVGVQVDPLREAG